MATRPPASEPASLSSDSYRTVITSIRVQGYKSLVDATLTVRPLTLLAGTNSSGKSSILQPLLLIKQTLQASYQTGLALLLDGPHVQITSAEQVVSKVGKQADDGFSLRLEGQAPWDDVDYLELGYAIKDAGFRLNVQTTERTRLHPGMPHEELVASEVLRMPGENDTRLEVGGTTPHFLQVSIYDRNGQFRIGTALAIGFAETLQSLLHIPGLRTAPKRSYPTAVYQEQSIRGTFDAYTASLIQHWQQQANTEKLTALTNALQSLGLTGSIEATTLNANELEVKVGRLPVGTKSRKKDLVNIADVGFGVSQVLPVVVALLVATPGQLVYIEQPELHLHPRAQVYMAHLLAEAARRGVRVVVETHSSLILLTIQTLVAEAQLTPDDVALHWFARDATGATQIALAEVDENGAYGPWPEDFGDVELTAQGAYLDAVARRQAGAGK